MSPANVRFCDKPFEHTYITASSTTDEIVIFYSPIIF